MRPLPWTKVEKFRFITPDRPHQKGDPFGFFMVPYRTNKMVINLRVMASTGDDIVKWEHVSVSCENRCPTWEEMDYIKNLFWGDEETVMQLHVPRSEHKNYHPYCLHLWKPTTIEIPRPPNFTVA